MLKALTRRGLGDVPLYVCVAVLLAVLLMAISAPILTHLDPLHISPRQRLRPPSDQFLFGTDMFGRDVWTRIVYGARTTLFVSFCVVVVSVGVGLFVGLLSGYVRWLDNVTMRVMDGIMAIPGILLAIAFVSVSGAGLFTVIFAIAIPEIPRVARLVRSVVLSIREEPYVEAAIGVGTPRIITVIRHVLPNAVPPLIVQGTYIFASAMLIEATLSFIGAGLPTEIPTWGNIIADGRTVFQRSPWIILYPGAFLAITILCVNVLGDALRDTLDPRTAKRVSR